MPVCDCRVLSQILCIKSDLLVGALSRPGLMATDDHCRAQDVNLRPVNSTRVREMMSSNCNLQLA